MAENFFQQRREPNRAEKRLIETPKQRIIDRLRAKNTVTRSSVEKRASERRMGINEQMFNNPSTRQQAVEAAVKAKDGKAIEGYRVQTMRILKPRGECPKDQAGARIWFQDYAQYIDLQFAGSDFEGKEQQKFLNEVVQAMTGESERTGKVGRYFDRNGQVLHKKIADDVKILQGYQALATPTQKQLLGDMILFLNQGQQADKVAYLKYLGTIENHKSPHHEFVNHVGKIAAFSLLSAAAIGGTAITLIRGFRTGDWKASPLLLGGLGAYAMTHPEMFHGPARQIAEQASPVARQETFLKNAGIRGDKGEEIAEEMFQLQRKGGGSVLAAYKAEPNNPKVRDKMMKLIGNYSALEKMLGAKTLKPTAREIAASEETPEDTILIETKNSDTLTQLHLILSGVTNVEAQNLVKIYIKGL